MQHFIKGENIGLILNKAHRSEDYRHSFISNKIFDFHFGLLVSLRLHGDHQPQL